jgi:hypothetical protein
VRDSALVDAAVPGLGSTEGIGQTDTLGQIEGQDETQAQTPKGEGEEMNPGTRTYLSGVISGIWICGMAFILAAALTEPPKYPQELSTQERAEAEVLTRTVPMDITLHALSHKAFNAAKMNPNAVAWTYYHKHPCEIVLEEGMTIVLGPNYRSGGYFADDTDANTLAHEWGHCIRGAWHVTK